MRRRRTGAPSVSQANHWPLRVAEIARMLASVSTHRSGSRTCDLLTSLFVWDHALRARQGGAAEG
jgi:hypothetical protein